MQGKRKQNKTSPNSGQLPFSSKNSDKLHFFSTTNEDNVKQFASWGSLDGLEHIQLNKLTVGKTHRGCFIKAKIATQYRQMTCILFEIEDESKLQLRLSVYNFPLGSSQSYQQIFWIGRELYVIEPFFKIATDGLPMIRVDAPAEIQFDDIIKKKSGNNPILLKERANLAYQANDFNLAVDLYKKAIDFEKNDNQFKSVCYSNMAACYNNLGCHETSLEQSALSIKFNPDYLKPKYHTAISLLELGRLNEASLHIERLQSSLKSEEIRRISNRLIQYRENQKGKFDWFNIVHSYFMMLPLEVADYTNQKLQIKMAPGMGLGVFANQDIIQGELLVVSKAFEYVNMLDLRNENPIFPIGTFHMSQHGVQFQTQSEMAMTKRITQLISSNHAKLEEFNQFCRPDNLHKSIGEREAMSKSTILPSAVDIKRVIKWNYLSFYEPSFSIEDFGNIIGAGLWKFPSYFNHSCDSNVTWFSIQKLLIMRASQPISAGEQLFIDYTDQRSSTIKPDELLNERQINCTCPKHQMEKSYKTQMSTYTKINREEFEKQGIKAIKKEIAGLLKQLQNQNRFYKFEILKDIVFLCSKIEDFNVLFSVTMKYYESLIEDEFPDIKRLVFLYFNVFPAILKLQTRDSILRFTEIAKQIFSKLFSEDQNLFEFFDNSTKDIVVKTNVIRNMTPGGRQFASV